MPSPCARVGPHRAVEGKVAAQDPFERLEARLRRLEEQVTRTLAEEVGRLEARISAERAERLLLEEQLASHLGERRVQLCPEPSTPRLFDSQARDGDGTCDMTISGGEHFLHRESDKVVVYLADVHKVRPYAESIWDASVLIGLPSIGPAGPILLTMVFNFFMQITFCVIIVQDFTSRDVPTMDSIRRWRLDEAHNAAHMDSNGVSLAARVCGGNMGFPDGSLMTSSTMGELKIRILKYTSPLFLGFDSGSLLCFVVLFQWWISVVAEIADALEFFGSFQSIHRAAHTLLEHTENGVHMRSVSHARFLFVLFVAVSRLGIAVCLGYSGSLWLCLTTSLQDLVLNAAALSFVLAIDELLYATMIPLDTRFAMEKLEPLDMYRLPSVQVCGFSIRVLIKVLLCLGTTLLCYTSIAMPMKDELQSLHLELCGKGELNFVVGGNELLGQPLVLPTSRYEPGRGEDDESLSYLSRAVQEVLAETMALHEGRIAQDEVVLRSSINVSSFSEFNVRLKATPSTQWAVECRDLDTGLLSDIAKVSYLRDLYDKPWAFNCQDFRDNCKDKGSEVLRWNCPITCGCHTPMSSLLSTTGCPSLCLSQRAARVHGLPCEDTSFDFAYSTTPLMVVETSSGYEPSETPLEALRGLWSRALDRFSAVVDTGVVPRNIESGCVDIFDTTDETQRMVADMLCVDDGSLGSTLQQFCPSMCRCHSRAGTPGAKLCPTACSAGNETSASSCEQGLCPMGTLSATEVLNPALGIVTTCEALDGEMVKPIILSSMINGTGQCTHYRQRYSGQCCQQVISNQITR